MHESPSPTTRKLRVHGDESSCIADTAGYRRWYDVRSPSLCYRHIVGWFFSLDDWFVMWVWSR